ncbi:MAG: aminopeptidase P family protein [Pyrinomonadaceae bacterium]
MKRVITWVLLIAFVLSGLAAVIMADVTTGPGGIKLAPAAPKFTDAERQSELARRRAAVAKRMAPNSIMILWSSEPRNYAGDVDFYYRQENNLYYLTNMKQGEATLVIAKNGDSVSEFLFMPKRNPQFETWNGKMYSNEDATRISGVKNVIDSEEQTAYFTALGKKEAYASKGGITVPSSAENIYLLLPNGERDANGTAEFSRESGFSKMVSSYKVVNARPIFSELRSIKSPIELKLLQHAIDITTEAQMRSMAMVGRAKMEYEVHAEVEYTFRRRNADYWGYPSIVGCGANATTLHYVESQGTVKQGDLMLMDVGAEYDHYTADVTRTYPVNGKFTKEQAAIYQIVYDAQEAVASVTKPEAKMSTIEKTSMDTVKAGLLKLGLITSLDGTYDATFNGQTMKISQHRLWFMHGNSHWLGMNVHDVGDYAAPLKPGMVFTNEPGVYLREDALDYLADTPDNRAFLAKVRPIYEKYRGIGVRIEDDMLVTPTGVEWMTKELPRKMDEIEAFMAKATKEFAYSAVNRPTPSSIFLNQSGGLHSHGE